MSLLLSVWISQALAFDSGQAQHLEIKWVRDSIEYRTLTEQIFRTATASVTTQAAALKKKEPWAVVLDIDETVLDNSPYFLERWSYDVPYDDPSWDAWTERRTAEIIPGAKAFVDSVRAAGGKVAFISNRNAPTRQATIDNLTTVGLWHDGDLICLLTDEAYTKRVRRTELRTGSGPCSWEGTPVKVLAYLGDTIGDLPVEGEDGARHEDLAIRQFVLPNPMYGGFEQGVTWVSP